MLLYKLIQQIYILIRQIQLLKFLINKKALCKLLIFIIIANLNLNKKILLNL